MIVFLIFLIVGILLTFYFLVRRTDPSEAEIRIDPPSLSMKIHDKFMELLKSGKLVIPKGLFVSNGHVWYKAIPEGGIKIGIDDFPLKLLGNIDKIRLNSPGESLNKRGRMCIIRQGRKKMKFISPIEGTITDVNRELFKNTRIMKDDPYEKGWLYIIKPAVDISYLRGEMEVDLSSHDWIEKEINKLSDFLVHEFPSNRKLEKMFHKDEIICEGILQKMDSFAWHKFQENFLR